MLIYKETGNVFLQWKECKAGKWKSSTLSSEVEHSPKVTGLPLGGHWGGRAGITSAPREPHQVEETGMKLLYPHHLIDITEGQTAKRRDNAIPGRRRAGMALKVNKALLFSDRSYEDQHDTKVETSVKII